jgi:hypothetical protein
LVHGLTATRSCRRRAQEARLRPSWLLLLKALTDPLEHPETTAR